MGSIKTDIYPIVSALLFSSESPLSFEALRSLLQNEGLDTASLADCLDKLEKTLQTSGIGLVQNANGYRIEVKADYLDWVYKLYQQSPPKLSRALLETLAIIAHKQPITRAEIEAIRGVSVSSPIMSQLKTQGWIKQLGVKEVPGYPSLWGTTQKLVDDLGFNDKDQLIAQLDELVDQFIKEQQPD